MQTGHKLEELALDAIMSEKCGTFSDSKDRAALERTKP